MALVVRLIQRRRVRRSPELAGGGAFRAFGFWVGGLAAVVAIGVVPATADRAWDVQGGGAIIAAVLGATGLLLLAWGEYRNAMERNERLAPRDQAESRVATALSEIGELGAVSNRWWGGLDARVARHAALALWVGSVAWLGLGGDGDPSWIWMTGFMLSIYHLTTGVGYVRLNRGGGIEWLQFAPVTGAFHAFWFLTVGFWL